jgi:hypothetical protein
VINEGIGHWPPSEMDKMSLDELYSWFDQAVDNIERHNDAIEDANR